MPLPQTGTNSNSSLKWLLPLALLLAAATLCFHYLRQPPPPQATLSELQLSDGKLFRKGKSTPFTGILVENYATNQLKSRSQMLDGVLNGLSEGWHTNGQLAITEHFSNGTSDGLRTKWHPNGNKQSEATIISGKIEGTFRRWAEDGTLQEEIEMKHNNPDGLSRAFYPSGFIKAEALFRDGKVISQQSWPDREHPAKTR